MKIDQWRALKEGDSELQTIGCPALEPCDMQKQFDTWEMRVCSRGQCMSPAAALMEANL